MVKDTKIYGIEIDEAGRCKHYHTEVDIAALLCKKCGKYYACYECHDALEDHNFQATNDENRYPVLCGICKSKLTKTEYKTGACPHCKSAFNPRCARHGHIYFCE